MKWEDSLSNATYRDLKVKHEELDTSNLKPVSSLPPYGLAVQEAVIARLRANPQGFVDEYRARFGDEFNPDNGAELFSEYRENRGTYRIAVAAGRIRS
jgi:hypothetical protein